MAVVDRLAFADASEQVSVLDVVHVDFLGGLCVGLPACLAIDPPGVRSDCSRALRAANDILDATVTVLLLPAHEVDPNSARVFVEHRKVVVDVAVLAAGALLPAA